MGKCKANDFASHIVSTPLTALPYIILSLYKEVRYIRDHGRTLWKYPLLNKYGALQEVIITITNLFGFTDEDIYNAIINKSEEMNHILNIYKLRMTS